MTNDNNQKPYNPPSRARYFKNHPSVNIRLKTDDLEALKREAERRNMSINKLATTVLTNLSSDIIQKEQAINELNANRIQMKAFDEKVWDIQTKYYQMGFQEGRKNMLETISNHLLCNYCMLPVIPFNATNKDDDFTFIDNIDQYIETEVKIAHVKHYVKD
ncbi:MAG: hypothetical protein QW292_11150 [Candidatus Parvarchaeota archaeon]